MPFKIRKIYIEKHLKRIKYYIGGEMKRKVIQIAESTQLVSLPRKWCIANSIKKGDELDVNAQGKKLIVSCGPDNTIERVEINIKDFGDLAPRVIQTLYKKGNDEIKVTFNNPEELRLVHKALKNSTVGYEIVDQSSKGCMIKNISSNIMGFDAMVRRTFLLLLSLADECAAALKNKDLEILESLLTMEESNNRFTTVCRRYMNKYGTLGEFKLGPLYYLVENLEKIADEYKYLIKNLAQNKVRKAAVTSQIAVQYEQVANLLRLLYESFYKFEPNKISEAGEKKKEILEKWYAELVKIKDPEQFLFMHHGIVIFQQVFNIIGPVLIFNTESKKQN